MNIPTNLRKTVLDPGVLFSLANIFAFRQSHSVTVLFIALVTFAAAVRFAWLAACGGKISQNTWFTPMRANGCGVLAASVFSFTAGAVLPGIAGLGFTVFSFLVASKRMNHLQNDPKASGWLKAALHPAIYCGIGYAMIGLMAGGGFRLLDDPLANVPALVMTCLGVGVTILSTIGLVSGSFQNPAAPFMAVALGTFINALAGIASGNILGTINNLLAMAGEIRVAWDAQDLFEAHDHGYVPVGWLAALSELLLWPLYILQDALTKPRL